MKIHFHAREKQEWTGANGSVEVASFLSFLFSLVVFYFTCRGMLCFSGAAVKGTCSILVVLQLKLWLLVFPFISV